MSKIDYTIYLTSTIIAFIAMICDISAQTNTVYLATISQNFGIESIELTVKYIPTSCDYYKLQSLESDSEEWEDLAVLLDNGISEEQIYTYNEERNLPKGKIQYRLTSITNDELKVISPITEVEVDKDLVPKTEVHKFISTDVETENVNLRLIINKSSDIEGGFYNSQGNLIQKVPKSKVSQGLNEFSFDISSIDKGQYLLILKVGGENIVEKIMI